MEKGYFASRSVILDWINKLLSLKLTKIQQLGSGSVYCQLVDAAFPQKVPLAKVKWNAYLQTDFLHNFKILQVCFEHLGIDKKIEIEKLAKAKYQDNLQFVQWLRSYLVPFIEQNKAQYDAVSRRKGAQVYLGFTEKKTFLTVTNCDKDRNSCKKSQGRGSTTKSQCRTPISNAMKFSTPQVNNRVQTANLRKSATFNRKNSILALSNTQSLLHKKSGRMTSSFVSLSKAIKADQNQYPVSDFSFTSPGKKLIKNYSAIIRNKKNQIKVSHRPLQDVKNLLESKYATSSCQILESNEEQPEYF